VTLIPIAADGSGGLWTSLKGKLAMEDFSAAAVTALAQELISDTRENVLYVEVDHALEADEGAAATILPFSDVVPGGSLVTGCIVSCREAFNGAETITIGRSGFTASILASANITKTLNAISGEDPTTYGSDLWVAGVGVPAQTATASDWTLTGLTLNEGTPNTFNSATQTKTAGNWAVTAWPNITTLGHPKMCWCANDTQYNAYRSAVEGSAEAGTTGILDCYLFYTRAVMSP
jgi:hypothetical protein